MNVVFLGCSFVAMAGSVANLVCAMIVVMLPFNTMRPVNHLQAAFYV